MQIVRLHLNHFKRFADEEICFAEKLNVLVGLNGAGKSSILDAISKMLSWYVRRMVSPQGNGNGTSIVEKEIQNGTGMAVLKLEAQENDQRFAWTLLKGRRAGELNGQKSDFQKLNEHITALRSHLQKQNCPIFVYYTVNRSVLDIPLRIRTHHDFNTINVNDDGLNGTADFRLFFEWFRYREDIQNETIADVVRNGGNLETATEDRELSVVKDALKQFLPHFEHWRIRRSPLRMEVDKEGKALSIDQLSDGEKNLIAMIGDLARRLVIANENTEKPLLGKGIALIDEVELHLHPQWQASVLPQLMNTFPNVQFIVSTHSPMVLSQLNSILYSKKKYGLSNEVAVWNVQAGVLKSMIDNETGLLLAGEMDEAVERIDREFERLLDEND